VIPSGYWIRRNTSVGFAYLLANWLAIKPAKFLSTSSASVVTTKILLFNSPSSAICASILARLISCAFF